MFQNKRAQSSCRICKPTMQGNCEIGKTDWSGIKLRSTISDPQPSFQCFTVIHHIVTISIEKWWCTEIQDRAGRQVRLKDLRKAVGQPNPMPGGFYQVHADRHPFTNFLIWLSKMQFLRFRSLIFATMNKINQTKRQKKVSRSKVTKMSF